MDFGFYWGCMVCSIFKKVKIENGTAATAEWSFFDAPAELFFTVNPAMGISTKMDIAMMMQNVMITAKARDSLTCPQAAWNHLHALVLNILDAAQFEELVCGMTMGYADPEQIVNRFITPRVPVEDFAVFLNNEWDLKHSFKYKKETKMSLFFI